MKISLIKRVLTLSLIAIPFYSYAQECVDYYRLGDCIMDIKRGYKIYSQSKGYMMSPQDSMDINVVVYGQKDYIFSFCTHAKLYPIRFRMIDPDTKEIIYDNKSDDFMESIGIGFDITRNITIRINLLARRATENEIEQKIGCLGMLIQYKNFFEEKRHIQL